MKKILLVFLLLVIVLGSFPYVPITQAQTAPPTTFKCLEPTVGPLTNALAITRYSEALRKAGATEPQIQTCIELCKSGTCKATEGTPEEKLDPTKPTDTSDADSGGSVPSAGGEQPAEPVTDSSDADSGGSVPSAGGQPNPGDTGCSNGVCTDDQGETWNDPTYSKPGEAAQPYYQPEGTRPLDLSDLNPISSANAADGRPLSIGVESPLGQYSAEQMRAMGYANVEDGKRYGFLSMDPNTIMHREDGSTIPLGQYVAQTNNPNLTSHDLWQNFEPSATEVAYNAFDPKTGNVVPASDNLGSLLVNYSDGGDTVKMVDSGSYAGPIAAADNGVTGPMGVSQAQPQPNPASGAPSQSGAGDSSPAPAAPTSPSEAPLMTKAASGAQNAVDTVIKVFNPSYGTGQQANAGSGQTATGGSSSPLPQASGGGGSSQSSTPSPTFIDRVGDALAQLNPISSALAGQSPTRARLTTVQGEQLPLPEGTSKRPGRGAPIAQFTPQQIQESLLGKEIPTEITKFFDTQGAYGPLNQNEVFVSSPFLPKDTVVEVTMNGKTIQAKVNDFGPNISTLPGRYIDLSVGACQQLGCGGKDQGTFKVVATADGTVAPTTGQASPTGQAQRPQETASQRPLSLVEYAGLKGSSQTASDGNNPLNQIHPSSVNNPLFQNNGSQSRLTKESAERTLSQLLNGPFKELQKAFGKPLIINDAIAKQGTSRENGTTNSRHFHGDALDISTRGLTDAEKLRLVEAAKEVGFQGYGFGENILHLDLGSQRAWSYGNSTFGGKSVSSLIEDIKGSTIQRASLVPSTSLPGVAGGENTARAAQLDQQFGPGHKVNGTGDAQSVTRGEQPAGRIEPLTREQARVVTAARAQGINPTYKDGKVYDGNGRELSLQPTANSVPPPPVQKVTDRSGGRTLNGIRNPSVPTKFPSTKQWVEDMKAAGLKVVDHTLNGAGRHFPGGDDSKVTTRFIHGDKGSSQALIKHCQSTTKCYSAVIAEDGTVHVLAGDNKMTFHAAGANTFSRGYVVARADSDGRQRNDATQAQVETVKTLTGLDVHKYGLTVTGHGQSSQYSIGGRHQCEGGCNTIEAIFGDSNPDLKFTQQEFALVATEGATVTTLGNPIPNSELPTTATAGFIASDNKVTLMPPLPAVASQQPAETRIVTPVPSQQNGPITTIQDGWKRLTGQPVSPPPTQPTYTPPYTPTPTQPPFYSGSSGGGGGSYGGGYSYNITPPSPSLPRLGVTTANISCGPNPAFVVDDVAAVRVAWRCENAIGSTGLSKLQGATKVLQTGGALAGISDIKVIATTSSSTVNIGVGCVSPNGALITQMCTLNLIEPSLTVTATPTSPRPGESLTLRWLAARLTATNRPSNCTLFGPSQTIVAEGRESGEVTITAPTTSSEYVLMCDADTIPVFKRIMVNISNTATTVRSTNLPGITIDGVTGKIKIKPLMAPPSPSNCHPFMGTQSFTACLKDQLVS